MCINGEGSKLIKDLPIGNYKVEQTDWSWRYDGTADMNTVKVREETPIVEFAEEMTNSKWLDGNCYKDNKFGQ